MATIRRDIAPGTDKKVTSTTPRTGTTTTKLRGTPSYPSKTNSSAKLIPNSTAPQKHTPNYLRPTRTSNVDVSKQVGEKPVSTVSVQKSTVSRIRPSDKTALTTTQKTRVSTDVSRGSSSVSGKTGVSQKSVPSKNVKAPVKDAGKRSSLYGRPVSTVKKSSIKKKEAENSTTSAAKEEQISNIPQEKVENLNTSFVLKESENGIASAAKEQQITNIPQQKIENLNTSVVPKEAENGIASAAKEQQITKIPQEKVENLNTSVVPKPEPQPQTEDIPETEEQKVKAVNNNEKGTDDFVMEDQEPLNIGQIESENVNKDASNIVIAEDITVSEHQGAPISIKTEEAEDKLHTEETSRKQEEQSMNEVVKSNNDENIADNPNEEEVVEEKEVVEVQETEFDKKEEKEVVEVQEIASDKKEEAANGSEANESKETEGREVVEKKKKEENIAPKGKKESAVSNDVIEETASKLREQRKNKVRALAGAFETVISLQETK